LIWKQHELQPQRLFDVKKRIIQVRAVPNIGYVIEVVATRFLLEQMRSAVPREMSISWTMASSSRGAPEVGTDQGLAHSVQKRETGPHEIKAWFSIAFG
jgi:hypothetical protein